MLEILAKGERVWYSVQRLNNDVMRHDEVNFAALRWCEAQYHVVLKLVQSVPGRLRQFLICENSTYINRYYS